MAAASELELPSSWKSHQNLVLVSLNVNVRAATHNSLARQKYMELFNYSEGCFVGDWSSASLV